MLSHGIRNDLINSYRKSFIPLSFFCQLTVTPTSSTKNRNQKIAKPSQAKAKKGFFFIYWRLKLFKFRPKQRWDIKILCFQQKILTGNIINAAGQRCDSRHPRSESKVNLSKYICQRADVQLTFRLLLC